MTDDLVDVIAELRGYLARQGLAISDDASIDLLNRLAWSRVFGLDGENLSIDELASRVGLDVADTRRLLRSLGFKGDGPWDNREVVSLALLKDAGAVFGTDTANHLARVIGSSTVRIAQAVADAVRIDYGLAIRADPRSGTYVDEIHTIAADMLPRLGALIDNAVRRHLLELVDVAWHPDEDAPVMVAHCAIGFADMVGFTSRSSSSSIGELTVLIDRFESEVTEAVV